MRFPEHRLAFFLLLSLAILLLCSVLLLAVSATGEEAGEGKHLSVVPKPLQKTEKRGAFCLVFLFSEHTGVG